MERILEKRYVLEYIRDTLNDLKQGRTGVDNARYNHNSDYSSASNIIRFGILSFLEQNRLGLRNDSPEFLQTMNDEESHINGINGISLSVVGLTDLYPNEDEYDPRRPHSVNFLVSSDIKTDRKAYHFGNEFIAKNSISPNYFRGIEVRLLKYMQNINKNNTPVDKIVLELIQKYNYLIDIAIAMKETKLDIPLREMSLEDNAMLDIDRLSKTEKLTLK